MGFCLRSRPYCAKVGLCAVFLLAVLWSAPQTTAEQKECLATQKLSADNDLLQSQLGLSVLRPSTDTLTDLTVTPSDSQEYCLEAQDSPAEGNYINVTFVHAMLVEKVVSRGLDFPDDGVSYVSNFSILYWSEVGGDTKRYDKFLTTSNHTFTTFVIGPSVYAIRVQFLINSAVLDKANIYCWHLDIYGCVSEPEPSSTVSFEPSSSLSFERDSSTLIPPSPSNNANSDSLLLYLPKIIAIPIGAGLILLILTILIGAARVIARKRMARGNHISSSPNLQVTPPNPPPHIKSNISYHVRIPEDTTSDILDDDGYVDLDDMDHEVEISSAVPHSTRRHMTGQTSMITHHTHLLTRVGKPVPDVQDFDTLSRAKPSPNQPLKYTTMLPTHGREGTPKHSRDRGLVRDPTPTRHKKQPPYANMCVVQYT